MSYISVYREIACTCRVHFLEFVEYSVHQYTKIELWALTFPREMNLKIDPRAFVYKKAMFANR